MTELPRATAAIDPPLFAGLYMFSLDLTPVFGELHGRMVSGHPAVDRTFAMRTHDMKRARELLFSAVVPAGLGNMLADAAAIHPVLVKDRVVEVLALDGIDVDDAMRTSARDLAAAVSRFSHAMEPTPAEIDARARWHDLAMQLGLSFDPRRWHMFGKFDGIDMSVTIEGSPPGVSTMFRAKWRMPLACGIVLRRGFRQSVGFTTWKDGDPPGFPELDKVMVMNARDPDRARALLADVALRSAIAGIAAEANIVIDDLEVSVGRGGFAGRTEIRQRFEELRWLVDKTTPPLTSGAGPFR